MLKFTLATIAALAASPTLAQSVCLPRADLVAALETRWLESPRMQGTLGTSAVYEMWASEAGTWTIVRTNAEGVSCIVAAGQDFEQVAPPPDGEPM